jgi:hypothetical protein
MSLRLVIQYPLMVCGGSGIESTIQSDESIAIPGSLSCLQARALTGIHTTTNQNGREHPDKQSDTRTKAAAGYRLR